MRKQIKVLVLIGFLLLICGFTNDQAVISNTSYGLTTMALEIEKVHFCEESGVLKTFQIIGYLLFVAKIIVPLLLIILGSIDFAKATISSDEKAPRDAVMSLVRRVLIAVIIFFIPTILNFLLSLVYGATEAFSDDSFEGCTNCLFDPFGECEATDING